MKKLNYWLAALIAASSAATMSGHGEEKQARELMQKKLTHSQKVLAGIALNDFDQIAKSADELIRISQDIEWKVLKTPKYELYSNEFRRAADGLRENAKTKNLDGATLAYVDMTLTCVRCHKHVRDVRDARLPNKRAPEGVAALWSRPSDVCSEVTRRHEVCCLPHAVGNFDSIHAGGTTMLAIRNKPFLSLTAVDLMSPGVVTIPQGMTLRTAAELLTREHINGAPVIDHAGRCIGNLSAADYLSFWTREPMTNDHTVKGYMTADPVTVGPTMPITDLTRKMIDAHIHRVIVVDEQDRPIGVVSSTDVLAAVTYGQHEPL